MKKILYNICCSFGVALLLLGGMTSCDNAGYEVIDNAIYVSEASESMLQKITVDDTGGKGTVSVRTNQKSGQNVTVNIGQDQSLLDEYNQKVGTSYVMLPAEYYELSSSTVTIESGMASANSVAVNIKPLPEEITGSGKKYAIPLSILSADGGTMILPNAKGVIYALDQVIVTSAPKVNRTNIIHYLFKENPEWSAWSIEMMVNMDNLGNGSAGNTNNQCIFNAGQSPDAPSNTSIFVRFGDAMIPGNKLQIKLCGNVIYESNIAFNINEWYHLAFVYDGSKFRVYIDGVLDKEADANYGAFMLNKDNIFSINGNTQYFRANMKIREVRMWSKAISQTQISENMYAVDPLSEGLEAYYKMNEGSGNAIKDATEHGNDGTIDGTPIWLDNVRSDKKTDDR